MNQIIWLISIDVPGENLFLQLVLHIQYCDLDNITQARATYCTKWNPWKFLMRYWLLQKKIFFSSFLAYLISKHYIANSIVLIKITLDKANWLW